MCREHDVHEGESCTGLRLPPRTQRQVVCKNSSASFENLGGVNFSVPPSSEHFFIRNYFKCYEPRENIIAYCFTTFKTANDEGFVITINGIYTKKGYNEPVFLPYQSAFPKFSAFWNSAKKIIKDFENKELQEKELIEKFSKTLLNEQLPVPPTERSQNIFSRVLLWRIQESSKFKFAKS